MLIWSLLVFGKIYDRKDKSVWRWCDYHCIFPQMIVVCKVAMKCIALIWTSLFCCRHHSESEGSRVPAFSSDGYSIDYWRRGDPGPYETVLGGEPGWETRFSRDKEDYAQSSSEQRHVSFQLYDMQESLKQTWTKWIAFCYQRSLVVSIWHPLCTKHSSVNRFWSWWNIFRYFVSSLSFFLSGHRGKKMKGKY